jgi:hypothetical protein
MFGSEAGRTQDLAGRTKDFLSMYSFSMPWSCTSNSYFFKAHCIGIESQKRDIFYFCLNKWTLFGYCYKSEALIFNGSYVYWRLLKFAKNESPKVRISW